MAPCYPLRVYNQVNFTREADGLLRATSVAVASGSDTAIINVAKEVILSAGTYLFFFEASFTTPYESLGSFQTPQLLELSGIGDKRVLGPLGIECLIDLPGVGENLRTCIHIHLDY